MSPNTLFKHIILSILTLEARLVIKKYKPRIIAITGSVGKTSTKDAIHTVLKDSFSVRSSKKSFNSEFGVPLTILDLPTGWNSPILWTKNIIKGLFLILTTHSYPDWLILEIGADHPGDISRIATWLPIDIAVLTRIGEIPVHVEFFPSVDDVVKEKASLLGALKKGGTAILNNDDMRIAPLATTLSSVVVTLCGSTPESDIILRHSSIIYVDEKPQGLSFDILAHGMTYPISLHHTVGKHHELVSLMAFAVGQTLGISPTDIITRLATIPPTPGRLRLIPGIQNSTIIDDTYNASPVAVEAGLETLGDIRTVGKKIAVLGDMRELGPFTESAHKQIGAHAVSACDRLLCVGQYAKYIAEGAITEGMSKDMISTYTDTLSVGPYLQNIISDHDVIFVKGSQGVRMERIVEAVMAHPEEKKNLLVRQEEEWMRR